MDTRQQNQCSSTSTADHNDDGNGNGNDNDEGQSIIQVSFLKSCCPRDSNISDVDHGVGRAPLSFSDLLSTADTADSSESPQTKSPPLFFGAANPMRRPPSYHIATPPPKARLGSLHRMKRKRAFDGAFGDGALEMPPPPTKRLRVSAQKSSQSPSLHSIDENSATVSMDGHQHHNGSLALSSRSSVCSKTPELSEMECDEESRPEMECDGKPSKPSKLPKRSKRRSKSPITGPLRRSARIQKKKESLSPLPSLKPAESSKSTKATKSAKSTKSSKSTKPSAKSKSPRSTPSAKASRSASSDQMESLSKPLSALRLQSRSESAESPRSTPPLSAAEEWTEMLSRSTSKWDAAATPTHSALSQKRRRRRSPSAEEGPAAAPKVNWGQISFSFFEQRCGIFSGGVPKEKGPSLHLGRFLEAKTQRIDDWESTARRGGVRELRVKERKQRVALFSPKDLGRKQLRADREEIRRLNKSRENIGCQCLSIFKMKKEQLIRRIVELEAMDRDAAPNGEGRDTAKSLKKMKKNECFELLAKMQFLKYGRFDVCCVDSSCECFRNGIECQIDSDCCDCGGDTVYNNFFDAEREWNAKGDAKRKRADSLCCGNPDGNTRGVIATDYRADPSRSATAVLAEAIDGFLAFESPAAQRTISEWNEHYGDYGEDSKENVCPKEKDGDAVRNQLSFE